ncbi:hypothetical protein GQ43DRAFT_454346 [Delitschia confertaspora ATCC 74209]|uniref:Copper-fist domain-containing protein n=1 Tax=Delitschia confertaspora ATCC 74209 TaxID=1513339 RepID=A0A9P4JQZ4_9PLEO|nr:hypothetical protein GQ43DRAFT_454346 [Delitschia confertaspora ATCC 74209]
MPVIDGEKWACASCIKGHRVSGCTHTDRELHHINPKGRPVKQCEHCRGARKSKSHHAKCECGDKKDKDKSKDKVDAKGEKLAGLSVEEVSNHAAVDGKKSCACHSGAKCICGLKKDTLGLKLDTGKHTLHGTTRKPKLSTAHSESTLTVFANGHHKPCHRNNNTAHVSGAPYKIPRPHTLHGHSAFASYSHDSLQRVPELPESPAPRAVDTWSLSNNELYSMFGSSTQRSVDSLPITPLTGALDSASLQDSLFTAPSSTILCPDGNSPESLSDAAPAPQWWSNPVNSQFGLGSLSTSPSQDCLPNLENEFSIPSAGLNNPLWSAGDLPLDPNKLKDTFTQPLSHSGESSRQSAPGLTRASSTQSELGEPTLFGDLDFQYSQSAVSELWEDSLAYRLAPTGASDVRPASTTLQSTSDRRVLSTSPNDASTAYPSTDYSEPQAVSIPHNLDDVVSNNPWLALDNSTFGVPPLDIPLEAGFDMAAYSNNWI